MMTNAAELDATVSRSSGSAAPLMSLTMSAPASRAAAVTPVRNVLIDSGADVVARSSSMTGTTRRISSSTGTGGRLVRAVSPPMSSMSAPSASAVSARSGTARRFASRPSPEKESLVRLRIAIR